MKKFTPKQKASIALAAIKGEKISTLSSRYQIHFNQIARWKKNVEDEIEIRIKNGFAYLMALMDWFSRYVVAWELSSTLENNFCVQALKKGLDINIPCIHNSDRGAQFTSADYIEILEGADVKISMDGRGRCMDNIFTERLWRSVKFENVYLNDYAESYNRKRRVYHRLEFGKPEVKKDLFVEFTVQDNKSGRVEYDSRHGL